MQSDVPVARKSCGDFVLDRAPIRPTLYFKSHGAVCFIYNHVLYLWNASNIEFCWIFFLLLFMYQIEMQLAIHELCMYMYTQMSNYFLRSAGFQFAFQGHDSFPPLKLRLLALRVWSLPVQAEE